MNRMLIAAAGNLWGICGDRPLRVGDLGQILARMSGMLKKQGTDLCGVEIPVGFRLIFER